MNHLGDITKINGYDAPVVDCIIGGSPCQDLSIAGKRAGLEGERSGLFMEQMRIIKEMRKNDRESGRTGVDVRPRFMVWENVPGSFSSRKGEDFRAVLEETAKVAEKDAHIPMPSDGKWRTSGYILGDGWSIAWRVLDAQFWGVPQRRRRIALIADFGGHSAPEILFVRKSVSRDIESSQPQGEETPSNAAGSVGADDIFCIDGDKLNKKERKGGSGIGYREGDKQYTLTAKDVHGVAYTLKIRSGCEGSGKGALIQTEKSATLSTLQDQTLLQPVPFVKSKRAQHPTDFESWKEGEIANTMNAFDVGDVRATEVVVNPVYSVENHPADSRVDIDDSGKVQTLPSKNQGGVAVCQIATYQKVTGPLMANSHPGSYTGQDAFNDMLVAGVDCRNGAESEINGSLQSNCSHSLNGNNVVRTRYIVRRLTPMECERLQGFPDGWTDIGEWTDSNGKVRKTSDAARYKALGNSIALPPWKWVLKRLCACYERDATMASLFDGIGGFPLIWEGLNGKGSCLWASEIEEFPIAVTKKRIGGD